MEKLIKKIETVLTRNVVTTAIIDGAIHMDFECDMDDANPLLSKVEDFIENEPHSYYDFNVAETFSDGTAFCTLKIVI